MSTPVKQFEPQANSTLAGHTDEGPAGRARYYDPENFFAFKWPAVPRRQFLRERDAAYADGASTGEVMLDASDVLDTPYPATTPLLLARYLIVRAGDTLSITRRASAEVFYPLRGAGSSVSGDEDIVWSTGDTFCFPGGIEVSHTAAVDAILFSVCNEPLLRYEDLQPPADGHERVRPLHWPKTEVDAQFEAIFERPDTAQTAGRALQLGSEGMAPASYPIPTMNVAINTLQPGGDQRPHRHNGVAITLAIQGAGTYSMIEDERVNWSDGAAQVTPATELHSHHNRGDQPMVSLVVQDEGLHFYTRTPGFSWT